MTWAEQILNKLRSWYNSPDATEQELHQKMIDAPLTPSATEVELSTRLDAANAKIDALNSQLETLSTQSAQLATDLKAALSQIEEIGQRVPNAHSGGDTIPETQLTTRTKRAYENSAINQRYGYTRD